MNTVAAQGITVPHLEYGQLAPMLIVFGVAVVGVLVEAFVPRTGRRGVQVPLTLVGILVALGWTFYLGFFENPVRSQAADE